MLLRLCRVVCVPCRNGFVQKAKRDGISIRALILKLLTEWVNDERKT